MCSSLIFAVSIKCQREREREKLSQENNGRKMLNISSINKDNQILVESNYNQIIHDLEKKKIKHYN